MGDDTGGDNRRTEQARAKHDLSEHIDLGIGVLLVNRWKRFKIGDDIAEILIIEVPEFFGRHDHQIAALVIDAMTNGPHPIGILEFGTGSAFSRGQVGRIDRGKGRIQ